MPYLEYIMARLRDRQLSVKDRDEVVISEDVVPNWLAVCKCSIRCGIGSGWTA